MRCLSPHPRMSNVMCSFPRRIYFSHYSKDENSENEVSVLYNCREQLGKKEGGSRMTEVSDLS